MSDGIGMVYNDVISTAHDIRGIADTVETIKSICDGVEAALIGASAIPGAAAVTGPVISIYESVAPTIGEIINLIQMVDEYLRGTTELMQAADAECAGYFSAIDADQLQSLSGHISK